MVVIVISLVFQYGTYQARFVGQIKNFSYLENIFCLMRFSLVSVKDNRLNGKDH